MELSSLAVVIWQVCLIEAIVCLILLAGIILATERWRMAIRRAIAGIGRGAMARDRREAMAAVEKETADVSGVEAEAAAARAGRALEVASSTARIVRGIKRHAVDMLRNIGATISSMAKTSLAKRREKPAEVSEETPSDMEECLAHIKNHASAIHDLTQASQELRDEVSEQHRVLSGLLTAMEKAPAGLESGVEPEEKPVIKREQVSLPEEISPPPPIQREPVTEVMKEAPVPGHFRHHWPPVEERETADKEEPAKKPSLPTRHTLATQEAIAGKVSLI
jgi:antitoxin component of RelBE/YafQ-DinJ toxin-antitoxin module